MFKIKAAAVRAAKASPDAYEFVKRREAKKIDEDGSAVPANRAYKKPGDPVTIGFGHTGEIDTAHGRRKPVVGDVITTEYAHKLFEEDAAEAEGLIDQYMGDISFTQGQRDAMFSFVFNIARKWLLPENNTFLRHWKNGTLTFEILAEYLPKYVNPRTIFEEGLFRRRLAELAMIVGVPPLIAEPIAWEAELKRDNNNEIRHRTDPVYIVLKADAAARDALPPEPKSPPVEDDAPSTALEDPDQENASAAAPDEEKSVDLEDEPKSDEVEKPVTSPTKKPLKYPKPQAKDPMEQNMTRPEFWSMNLLIFGRMALALGMIPAAMTDMILDPNFQAAVGGVIAIYVAMAFQARNAAIRREKQAKKREVAIGESMDALREQHDAGLIGFEEYDAEVRELVKLDKDQVT